MKRPRAYPPAAAPLTYAGFTVREAPDSRPGRRIYCVGDDNGLFASVYATAVNPSSCNCDEELTAQEEWEAWPQDGAARHAYYNAADMIKAAQAWQKAAAECSDLQL